MNVSRNAIIGLSLSQCVLDLAKDEEDIEDVVKIITGTCVAEADWPEYIKRQTLADGSWHSHPQKTAEILRTLLAEKKIEQPRLEGKPCPHVSDGKRWIPASEAGKIKWLPVK